MKEFLSIWALSTISVVVTFYWIVFIAIGGWAFIVWSLEPIQEGLSQLDWITFRVTVCISIVIGFILTLAILDDY